MAAESWLPIMAIIEAVKLSLIRDADCTCEWKSQQKVTSE